MAVLAQSSLGTMRLNASRLNYHNALLYATVNGVDRRSNVRREGAGALTIHRSVNSAPDTASMRVDGFTPAVGQDVKIYTGSTAPGSLQFAGTIQKVTQVVEAQNRINIAWDIDCIDYAWLMDRRLVFKSYTLQSASTIAADLITSFTTGFTTVGVQANLPVVSIVFPGVPLSDALTSLANLIGAHWKVSFTKDLRFATTSVSGVPDPDVVTASTSRSGATMDEPIAVTSDESQVRTRVFVIGKGSRAAAAAAVGDSVVPVEDSTFFSSGTALMAGQRVSYTGVAAAFTGSIVGAGSGPTTAPTTFLNSTASSLTPDAPVTYAVTFVTAAGETTPGPTITVTPKSTSLPTPTETPVLYYNNPTFQGGLTTGGSYQYKLTAGVDGGGETDPGPASAVIVPVGTTLQISWSMTLAAGTRYVSVYRTTNGGGTFKLVQQIDLSGYPGIVANGGTWGYGSFIDTTADGSLGAAAPSSDTASRGAVNLSGIPIGGATVTQRKVYRTAANGSQLKLLATIANNTATTYGPDTAADSALGANVPSSDGSGLTMPTGTVNAGSTTLRVAGTGQFSSTGGWVRVGNQSVKYTGTDSQNLTGIPSSGVGALTSTVSYGTAVTIPPTLTGIPTSGPLSLSAAVNVGDDVRPYVQRDDTAAQTALAALEGGDGIHEAVIDDDTLTTVAAMNTVGDGELALFKSVEQQVRFSGRDYKLEPGATATLNVSAPNSLTGSFLIQSVELSLFGFAFTFPLRSVTAGTTRLTLQDFLRQVTVN